MILFFKNDHHQHMILADWCCFQLLLKEQHIVCLGGVGSYPLSGQSQLMLSLSWAVTMNVPYLVPILPFFYFREIQGKPSLTIRLYHLYVLSYICHMLHIKSNQNITFTNEMEH
jgi:hypothetical protein